MNDAMIRLMQLSKQGYACAQILLIMGLEARGEENPDLVRAMSGLAYGCGDGRGTCGALTGGCCLLGVYAGKGTDSETQSDRFALMLAGLTEWFAETAGAADGAVSCDVIAGGEGPAASLQRCGELVSQTYAKIMEILVENGFDPAGD